MKKSNQVKLFDSLLAKSQEAWKSGEYGEGLPPADSGYFWMDADNANSPSSQMALDTSGHIWVMVKKN